MILNENLIRNKVLKSTLLQQIKRIAFNIYQMPRISCQIQNLSQQIHIRYDMLQQQKQQHSIFLSQKQKIKQQLRQQLKEKTIFYLTQKSKVETRMKQLSFYCNSLRQKRQKLMDSRKKTSKFINQLEQLQIYSNQAQNEVQILQIQAIEQKKKENEFIQTLKQFSQLIQAKKSEKSLQNNLLLLLKSEVNEQQLEIAKIKDKLYDTEINRTKRLSQLQKSISQMQKLSKQISILSQSLVCLKQKNHQLQQSCSLKKSQTLLNTEGYGSMSLRIQNLIDQSNELSQKIVQTRQFLVQANITKNKQTLLNKQLKAKIRSLMKIIIDYQNSSAILS